MVYGTPKLETLTFKEVVQIGLFHPRIMEYIPSLPMGINLTKIKPG